MEEALFKQSHRAPGREEHYAYLIRARMSKRKREEDAPTTNTAKRGTFALVDMKDVLSRHTGLSVDYEKPCSRSDYRLCHVCADIVAWNGFFVNIGLHLQERSTGGMGFVTQLRSKNAPYKATQEEKAQAATLLHWLLTKHTCVEAVLITEDVFRGNEEIVCSALSGSVGVRVLTLKLSSSTVLLQDDLMSSIHSMKHLDEVNLIVNPSEALFSKLSSLLKTSSPLQVLRTVDVNAHRRRQLTHSFEDFSRTGPSFVSIATRPTRKSCESSRPYIGLNPSNLMLHQSLTVLKFCGDYNGPRVDVRAICKAVAQSRTIIQLDLTLLKLEVKHAAPIRMMLASAATLEKFSLSYLDIAEPFTWAVAQRSVDSSIPHYDCLDCRLVHMLETYRVKPWIEALLQASRSVTVLRFSLFAFCALECRAFLNALSKNFTLKKVTIPILGQNPSEFCTVQVGQRKRGRSVNVPFVELEHTLSDVASCGLVTEVRFTVRSFLCLSGETDPTSSAFVQLIRKAPALVAVHIQVENGCCSRCWNETAPVLCDAVLHNTSIGTLGIKLPKNPTMHLLPLVNLLHRSRWLYKFTLEVPCHMVLSEFVTQVSVPELWDNYSLEFVDLGYNGPELQEQQLTIQSIANRNKCLANRAVSFLAGRRSKDNAAALEKMASYPFLVKKVCDSLPVNKQLVLDSIAERLRTMADMGEFMRLSGVVNRKIVCDESSDGSTQLTDLNEYCLRHIRQYLSISDITDRTI
ncbi:hypothetical protein HPB50_020049 [Hyalomma asiaticum]|uniref:Uncharacterized protein n=1 Tax=Hyalomma asiaticum TaxID=266040 RepID=A0ACB7RT89_HYAAI|nr:hypothetical protein HPB50_020049 [Hyalomma asiaticum]